MKTENKTSSFMQHQSPQVNYFALLRPSEYVIISFPTPKLKVINLGHCKYYKIVSDNSCKCLTVINSGPFVTFKVSVIKKKGKWSFIGKLCFEDKARFPRNQELRLMVFLFFPDVGCWVLNV